MRRSKQAGMKMPSRIESAGRRGLVNGNGLTNGKGYTNGSGLTNGIGTRRGRTNGLVNGVGRVNGTGMTNGFTNGLTNGTRRGKGLVNGRGLVNGIKLPLRRNLFGVVTHKDLRIGASLALLFILLLPSFYLLMSVPVIEGPVKIDGDFGDWANVPAYIDQTSGTNPNVAFTRYALTTDDASLYIMIRVAGQVFPEAQGYDGFFAFIDSDANRATGYWPGELGAEYAAAIFGGAGKVAQAELTQFTSTGDQLNWSAWNSIAQLSAAFSGNALEFAVPLDLIGLHNNWTLRLVSSDFEGAIVMSSVNIGNEFGALRAEQLPRTDYAPVSSTAPDILRVRLHAYGETVILDNLVSRLTWQFYPASLSSAIGVPNTVMVEADTEQTISISIDVSAMASGTAMWLNLTNLVAEVPVTIGGDGGVGYAKQVPQERRIDGWFGDWQTGLLSDARASIADPNIDVRTYASNVSRSSGRDQAFLYVDFRGRAMGGTIAPTAMKWSQGGQSAPPSPPSPGKRNAGEDVLAFYIDTNSSRPGGCAADNVAANFKIEITGHRGRVDSKGLYSCVGGSWVLVSSATVSAMNSGSKIETGIDLSLLGNLDKPDVVVEATDWNRLSDIPDPMGLGTRSAGTRSLDQPHVLADPPGLQWMISLPLSQPPTLDGQCQISEYAGAGHNVSTGYEWYVGHVSNFVWVCVVFKDITQDNGDYATLYVDSSHDSAIRPQLDDRNYTLFATSSNFLPYRGDGNGWTNCLNWCASDAGQASFYNSAQNYEFQIIQRNIWNLTSGTPGLSGFAIRMHNVTGPRDYWWGSSSPNVNNPSTWGHLEIPEFPVIIMPFTIVAAIVGMGRRRRRA